MTAIEAPKRTGVVSEVYPNLCNVILDRQSEDDTPQKIQCSYRRSKVIERGAEWRERSPVAPGDKVEVKVLGSKDGVVETILPRMNKIQRRAPGREGKIVHTLAANLDFVIIVASLHEPEFSPGLVDRFLIAVQAAEIKPFLVINKMDLRDKDERPWKIYEDFGITCFPISTVNPDIETNGIAILKKTIQGKTSVFCGHSGVGKTSLLHILFGKDMGKIGAISAATGKGKHTTSVSTLIETSDGSRFIDTPGIKEFGLVNIDPKTLIEFFPALYEAQQKREPIHELPRYDSYIKIKAALDDEGR